MKQKPIALLFVIVLFSLEMYAQVYHQGKDNIRQWRISQKNYYYHDDYHGQWSRTITTYYYNQFNIARIDSSIIIQTINGLGTHSYTCLYSYAPYHNVQLERRDTFYGDHLSSRQDILYDEENRIKSDRYYYMSNDTLRLSTSTQNFYNLNGQLVLYYQHYPNNQTDNRYKKFEITYNNQNLKQTLNEFHGADSLNMNILYTTGYRYTVGANPKLDSDSTRYWNGSAWQDYTRGEYGYFDNDQRIVRNVYDQGPFGWISERYEYIYQDNRLVYDGFSTPTTIGDYDWETGYTWEDFVLNDDETQTQVKPSLKAYPNPFINSVTINFISEDKSPVKLTLYNIKGQLVRKWDSINSNELVWDGKDSNMASTAGGLYLLKIEQNGKTATTKLLKYK